MKNLMQVIVEGVHAHIAQELRHPPVRSVEWTCQHCGAQGGGFPPEEHSSGACGATVVQRPPFRIVPEVAREAQALTLEVLGRAPHFVDGGGI